MLAKVKQLNMELTKVKEILFYFPSDDEYKVDDIEKVITPILLGQSKVFMEVE